MRIRSATLIGLFVLFLLYPASSRSQYSAPSSESITGLPGVVTEQTTMDFSQLPEWEARAGVVTQEPIVHEHMIAPHDLPVPASVALPRELPPAPPRKELAPAAPSPAPVSSFLGLGDNNSVIPPDTNGAVGPNHLMVTLNSQVRIQDRSGVVISTVSHNSFWAGLGNPSAFDPRVVYEPFNNRWIFVAVSNAQSANSSVLLATSQTSDPRGAWNLYRIDADPANLMWADFPTLGFNKNWIVVQVNMFPISGSSFRTQIYAFNKASLYSGGTATYTLFSQNNIGGTQVPAVTFDNFLPAEYLLQEWNGNSGGFGFLRLYTITGSVGSEVLTGIGFPVSSDPWQFSPATNTDFSPQLGSTRKIMANDADIHNLVYRNGSLWSVHTVFLPATGLPTRCSIQWWQLTPLGIVEQRGRIDDPAGATFYAFPSIGVNKNSDVLIGYSRFSATQYASANYSFRSATDSANTLRSDTVLKAGEAPYSKTFSGTRNRWGDYSHTVVDPANDIDLWTIQEYAANPSGGFDRWGTWWGRVVLSPGVAPMNFFTITPCRVADTRNTTGAYGGPALNANTERSFVIGGRCGIPAGAKAVSLNITVTGATAFGDLRLYAIGGTFPSTSVINYGPGQTRASSAIIPLSDLGALNVFTSQPSGTVHFIVDLNGYFQ